MTVAVNLCPPPRLQEFTNFSTLLAGGKLWTYQAGGSTPAATYTDSTGNVANTNPVILNARGEASVWLIAGQAYKLVLQDASGVQIWSQDNIRGINDTSGSGGSATIGFIQAGTGAVARTVQSKLRDVVSPADFGAIGDGVTDDTAAVQAALTFGTASNHPVDGDGLTYKTSAQLTMAAGSTFVNATLQMSDTDYLALAYNSNCVIRGVKVLGTGRTNQYPNAQRGIGEQTSGSTNVTIDARVEACNSCVDMNGTSDSTIDVIAVNASGQIGISEGYGVIAYQSANRNRIRVHSQGAARHALYLSSGSSQNVCVSQSIGTKSDFAVQINSTKNQAPCVGNYITGSSYGDFGGATMFMDVGVSDTGGTIQDNVIDAFSVVALAAPSGLGVANGNPAFLTSFANAGATPATGNCFRNCSASGQFNSTTLGIVELNAGWSTNVDNMQISALCANTATAAFLINAPAGGVTRVRGLNMDLLTSSASVVGVQVTTSAGLFQLDDAELTIPGATKLFYSGNSAQFRVGVAAGGKSGLTAGTVVVPYSSITASSRINLTCSSPGGTLGFLSYVLNPGTGFTINSSNAADTSTVAWQIVEGTP